MENLNPDKNINEEELKTNLKELYPTIDDEFIINQAPLSEEDRKKIMISDYRTKFNN